MCVCVCGTQALQAEVLNAVVERGALREALVAGQGEQALLRHELDAQVRVCVCPFVSTCMPAVCGNLQRQPDMCASV